MEELYSVLARLGILEIWFNPLASPNDPFELDLLELRNEFELMFTYIQLRKHLISHCFKGKLKAAGHIERFSFYQSRLDEESEAAETLLLTNTKEAILYCRSQTYKTTV